MWIIHEMRYNMGYFKHFVMFSSQFSNSFANIATFLNNNKHHYCINYLPNRNKNTTVDKFINHFFFKSRKENWSHKIVKQLLQCLTQRYEGVWKVLHNMVRNNASPVFHVWSWERSVFEQTFKILSDLR